MKKLQERGGEKNIQGIKYQICYAIYYFLFSDISEIFIEWLDEDAVIINEDRTAPSLEFVQCKYVGSGVLHFSKFCDEVLKKFVLLFKNRRKDDPFTKYSFKIVCNKGFDKNLDRFANISEMLKSHVLPKGIEELYGRTILDRTRKYFSDSEIDLYCFLQSLNFAPNVSDKYLIEEITRYLVDFGSQDPDRDLNSILGYFMKRVSGKITKNQLQNDLNLEYALWKLPEDTSLPFDVLPTDENIKIITTETPETLAIEERFDQLMDDLDRAINYVGLTANQLFNYARLYPKRAIRRTEIERNGKEVKEIADGIPNATRNVRKDFVIIIADLKRVKRLRDKHELDKSEG